MVNPPTVSDIKRIFSVVLPAIAEDLSLSLQDDSMGSDLYYNFRDPMGRVVATVSYGKRPSWKQDAKKSLSYSIIINHCSTFHTVERIEDFAREFVTDLRRIYSKHTPTQVQIPARVLARKITFKDVSGNPIEYFDMREYFQDDVEEAEVVLPEWLL